MYLISTVPQDITDKLNEVIKGKNLQPANMDLAGNIKNEFLIPEGKEHVYPLIFALIDKHKEQYPQHFKKITGYTGKKEISLQLHSLWVNFQKKYEFNPMHVHDGLYSFVIWHKVPYTIDNEKQRFTSMREKDIRAGMFSFFYTDPSGKVTQEALPVDNSWEGKVALFPAMLNHMVYPFYTSDDYRISISGNLGFKI